MPAISVKFLNNGKDVRRPDTGCSIDGMTRGRFDAQTSPCKKRFLAPDEGFGNVGQVKLIKLTELMNPAARQISACVSAGAGLEDRH
ncbi:hypothetical protein DCMF_06080 [Candidatus Formimonas warabiya]|uniref:Uncharacterized protein n=1 Tax=Formimonas warabiya TaxID=1761012 RepID=A0A3G1KPP3_FORW1|nr:hypothetical protein DCMF_06080 [Candidatus Formimonas warabiya]